MRIIDKIAWKRVIVARSWEGGVILPFDKKGDTGDCQNYGVVAKIYGRVLKEKLRTIIE